MKKQKTGQITQKSDQACVISGKRKGPLEIKCTCVRVCKVLGELLDWSDTLVRSILKK